MTAAIHQIGNPGALAANYMAGRSPDCPPCYGRIEESDDVEEFAKRFAINRDGKRRPRLSEPCTESNQLRRKPSAESLGPAWRAFGRRQAVAWRGLGSLIAIHGRWLKHHAAQPREVPLWVLLGGIFGGGFTVSFMSVLGTMIWLS